MKKLLLPLIVSLSLTPSLMAQDMAAIKASVAHPDRVEADVALDKARQPAKIMKFMKVEKGMKIFDLFSGGGYYSELLSRVVGPEGSITAHNNEAYRRWAGSAWEPRYGNNRLPNVTFIMKQGDEIEVEAGSLDMVWMALTYHDLYHTPTDTWHPIDVPRLLKEFYEGLKPGGTVLITDHVGANGTGLSQADTIHRIEPKVVIDQMVAAGFKFDGKSDTLSNSEDDHTKSVFAPELRRKTDRFIYRFVRQ